jgi:carboxylesterase
VLLLHGYTGTPFEVATVAHALHEAGYEAHVPLLPGHGGDPAALNRLSRQAWLDAARTELLAVSAKAPARPVFVVGGSMGGLLALLLAAEPALAQGITAMALLAPALRYHPGAFAGVLGLSLGLWRLVPFLPKEGPGGDVGAADAQATNPTYKTLPTAGLAELLALQWECERALPKVTAPLCVLHGELDKTIAPVSSRIVAARVNSAVVEHHRLRDSRHLAAIDVQRDLVCQLVTAFFDRHLHAHARARSAS